MPGHGTGRPRHRTAGRARHGTGRLRTRSDLARRGRPRPGTVGVGPARRDRPGAPRQAGGPGTVRPVGRGRYSRSVPAAEAVTSPAPGPGRTSPGPVVVGGARTAAPVAGGACTPGRRSSARPTTGRRRGPSPARRAGRERTGPGTDGGRRRTGWERTGWPGTDAGRRRPGTARREARAAGGSSNRSAPAGTGGPGTGGPPRKRIRRGSPTGPGSGPRSRPGTPTGPSGVVRRARSGPPGGAPAAGRCAVCRCAAVGSGGGRQPASSCIPPLGSPNVSRQVSAR